MCLNKNLSFVVFNLLLASINKIFRSRYNVYTNLKWRYWNIYKIEVIIENLIIKTTLKN